MQHRVNHISGGWGLGVGGWGIAMRCDAAVCPRALLGAAARRLAGLLCTSTCRAIWNRTLMWFCCDATEAKPPHRTTTEDLIIRLRLLPAPKGSQQIITRLRRQARLGQRTQQA